MKRIIYIILSFLIAFILMTSCSQNTEKKTDEYDPVDALEGKWTCTIGSYEASLTFVNNDRSIRGTWERYDSEKHKWSENTFRIKKMTEFTLTFLFDSGDMETVSFSVSKNILYCNGLEYQNNDKNVPLPKKYLNAASLETIPLIEDGVIKPIADVFYFGMTKEEVSAVCQQPLSTTSYDLIQAEDYLPPSCDEEMRKSWIGATRDTSFHFTSTGEKLYCVRYCVGGWQMTSEANTKARLHVLAKEAEFTSKYGTYSNKEPSEYFNYDYQRVWTVNDRITISTDLMTFSENENMYHIEYCCH